jgi:hypothetical protein
MKGIDTAAIALKALLREERVEPTPEEAAEAAAALAEVGAELPELGRLKVRFYEPVFPRNAGTDGVYESVMRRTLWVRAGQPLAELRDTVRHEAAHAAQYFSADEIGHKHDVPARYARGSRKARKRLRRRLRDASLVYRIVLTPKETP